MTSRVPEPPEPWSPARLFAVRFAFLYLVLYGLPPMLLEVPGLDWLMRQYSRAWDAFVVWFGGAVLRLEVPPEAGNGSGDQLVHYVGVVALLLITSAAALVWSLVDRRRRDHRALGELLHLYLRYFLAFTMFVYGMAKVFKSQFPEPPAGRLLIPIGQTSPMGLLWTFMGQSTLYTVLAGLAEVVGGALLLFRRTTTLGALVLLGVLGNVVALNVAYDVPVKLFSSHLLLMVILLLARDARRLLDFLVRNRAVPAADLGRPPLAARWPRAIAAARVVLVAAMLLHVGHISWSAYRSVGDGRARGPLEGAYRVLAMERDGAPVALSDPSGWRQVAIGSVSFLTVAGDGAIRRYGLSIDAAGRTLAVVDRADPTRRGELTVTNAGDQLQLAGDLAGARVSLRLRAMAEEEFLLRHRGFHWVNPEPFNR